MNKELEDIIQKSKVKKESVPIKGEHNKDILNFIKAQPQKKDNFVSKYIVASLIDFAIFGGIYILLSLIKNVVLITYYDHVLVFDEISFIVTINILLISYFYFNAKDNKGSTIGMRIQKIKIVKMKKDKEIVNWETLIIKNPVFWFYFLAIDLILLNNINGLYLNISAMVLPFSFLPALFSFQSRGSEAP